MISSLRGVLTHKSPQSLVVDVHGVGFQVYSTLQSFYHLPEVKESIFLHTYTHLKDDGLELYGFLTLLERETFVLLLGVSGIGPRSALNILSRLSVEDLIEAIQSGNVHKLTAVPGIGAKTAGRMALELKDKLAVLPVGPSGVKPQAVATDPGQKVFDDALSALVNLGYPRQQVKEVLSRSVRESASGAAEGSDAMTVEGLIRAALKQMSK